MTTPADPLPLLLARFPALSGLDPAATARLAAALRPLRVPAGTVLFRDGTACEAFLLVLDGCVRVHKVAESGREIVLYRVEAGQTCVLTTGCLMAGTAYGADGMAESPVHGLALSPTGFEDLLATSAVFRRFVFSAYATRIADLLLLIEEVAFGRIDARLAQVLLARAGGGATVAATHQDLAVDLGSAREVVSRQLKEFERRGWVTLHRGRVDIAMPRALRDLVTDARA